MYPTICLAVLSAGAILATTNPMNTASEIFEKVTSFIIPTIMKGYLGNEEATIAMLDLEGWLKIGGSPLHRWQYFYVVDRIKELIKHNGYQVEPAEVEALLLSHPNILDSAVIPIENEEAGPALMAYIVKKASSDLTEEKVIRYVAKNVAPYKKVRTAGVITVIPKSLAWKILRKELISLSGQQVASKLRVVTSSRVVLTADMGSISVISSELKE